ncbi:MAG: methyltransferase domain-containing protein [Bacteroidota bacterium]
MKWDSKLYDGSHGFVSKFGEGIYSYLQPQVGERILDLGCGTGDLALKIKEAGAEVFGVDNSPEMIAQAKEKYPDLDFAVADGRTLGFTKEFDAIFSNAVLHWIPEYEAVIEQMSQALKAGGRIVLEFGGKGNIAQMVQALQQQLAISGYEKNSLIDFWFFPSIGEYSSALERAGFRVVHAEHFDRPTPLKGPDGMKDWFRMFADRFFAGVPQGEREKILDATQESLRPTHYSAEGWLADYKRIRIIATK